MSNLKVSIKLKIDINDKIDLSAIATWEYDVTESLISHKGDQYRG